MIKYYYVAIVTYYYKIITMISCYYIFILTSFLHHYYIIITPLLQMAESCNNDLIFPIITLGVPIVIPLLPIICIITYYYVFDSEQLADEIENHNSFQFDMQIEDYDIMQDPYLDTNNMMAMCAWGTGNKAMALPCDLMVIHW